MNATRCSRCGGELPPTLSDVDEIPLRLAGDDPFCEACWDAVVENAFKSDEPPLFTDGEPAPRDVRDHPLAQKVTK